MTLSKYALQAMLAITALSGAVSQAAIVITQNSFANGTDALTPTYAVSATDLLTGIAPVVTGGLGAEGTGGASVLTDGVFPDPVTRGDATPFQFSSFAVLGNGAGTSLTYTLASTSNLNSIVVTGGWQDSGRDQQAYSVLYSTVADPTTFIPLTSVDYNPADSAGHPQVTQVAISDNAGVLAANVAAIRFTFGNVENGYTGYGEIDVNGVPVPEPSTLALAGAGAVGLVVAARRRRSA